MTKNSKASFWTSLPGILTGSAAVLTALTGSYLAFRDRPAPPPPPTTEPSDSVLARSFIQRGSFPVGPPTEFILSPQDFGLQDTTQFLTLVDAAFGSAMPDEAAPNIFRLELRITNTTSAPIHLDLTSRFFSLEDDRGQRATLRHFCCRAQGDPLAPGQSRSVVLFFHSSDWYGKSINARRLLLKVTGLLPVERATWELPVLATAA